MGADQLNKLLIQITFTSMNREDLVKPTVIMQTTITINGQVTHINLEVDICLPYDSDILDYLNLS